MNLRSANRTASKQGFTVLEVLISMAVLAVIALGIYRATTQTYAIRRILQVEGDFFNAIRLSMGILEKDISMVYNPTIMLPEKDATPPSTNPSGNSKTNPPPKQTSQSNEPTDSQILDQYFRGDQNRTTDFWRPISDRTGVRASRFIGREAEMSFIGISHTRIYKNSKESVFGKISYELREFETEEEELQGSKVLIRKLNTNAFEIEDPEEEQYTVYPLLYGIKDFKLEYYHKEEDKWLKEWDSDDSDLRDVYPDVIKLTLSVVGTNRLSYDGIYQFRPEVPLNGLHPSL